MDKPGCFKTFFPGLCLVEINQFYIGWIGKILI